MKIKRFNENIGNDKKPHRLWPRYVFVFPSGERTLKGSIWSPSGKWIPDSAKLVAEFECMPGFSYMIVDQEELDEINNEKEKIKIKTDANKYNL